jgi:hypothetical protein
MSRGYHRVRSDKGLKTVKEGVKRNREGVPACHRAAHTMVRSSPHQGQDADHLPSEQDGVPYAVEEMAAAAAVASAWPWVDPQEQKGKLLVDNE